MYTLLCLVLVALTAYPINGSDETERKFEFLFNQIEILKAKDADKEAQIKDLKTDFATREQALLTEISDLRSKIKTCKAGEVLDGSSTKRAVSQTQVAFYAIAPDFDFSAMGANQNLIFDTPFTNIGNAFRNSHGIFTAPVRGVYVFFITIGGNIHNSNYFYVDVSGVMEAKILLLSNSASQSSETVVVSLKPGDEVSVKAGRDHDGAYGAYYTSIGGFLLYENVIVPAVGK